MGKDSKPPAASPEYINTATLGQSNAASKVSLKAKKGPIQNAIDRNLFDNLNAIHNQTAQVSLENMVIRTLAPTRTTKSLILSTRVRRHPSKGAGPVLPHSTLFIPLSTDLFNGSFQPLIPPNLPNLSYRSQEHRKSSNELED